MKRTPRGLARRPLWRRLKGTESAKPKKVAREITLLALHMGCGRLPVRGAQRKGARWLRPAASPAGLRCLATCAEACAAEPEASMC